MTTIAIYLLNAVLTVLLLRRLAAGIKADRAAWTRMAAVGILLFLDGCFILFLDCSMRAVAYLAILVAVSSTTFPDAPMQALDRALGRSKFLAYLLSVFTLAALANVYLPITTFLTSPGEIAIHLNYLVSNNARDAMVVVYLAAALYGVVVSPRMRTALTVLVFCALIVALSYAYLLPFGYPRMNGLMFEQIPIPPSTLAWRSVVDVALMGISVVGGVTLLVRFRSAGVIRGIALLNVSLVIASLVNVTSNAREYEGMSTKPEGDTALLYFARDRPNVLVLMLDRLMGGFIEGILEREPELATRLDGFVWYPKSVSAGENSIAGVHPLLGGYDYLPVEMNARGQRLRDLSVEAFSILPYNFTKAGWEVNLVNPGGLGFTMDGDCRFLDFDGLKCGHIPSSVSRRLAERLGVPLEVLSESSYANLLVLLASMRIAPYLAKAVLAERGPWQPFLNHSAGTTFNEWARLKSLPEVTSTEKQRSNLNIVFNLLPHEPYFLGDDCLPRAKTYEVPEEEVRRRGYTSLFALQHAIAARCSLLLVADYLDWLKASGVYDDTKIVIVSDHGVVGPVKDRSSRAVAGGTTENQYVRMRSTLLVKDRGAKGPLSVSEVFMPNAEVPRVLCEEIDGCTNPFLGGRTIEAHGRDDPFHIALVPWQFNLQYRDAFKVLQHVVVVNKDPYAAKNWRELRQTP